MKIYRSLLKKIQNFGIVDTQKFNNFNIFLMKNILWSPTVNTKAISFLGNISTRGTLPNYDNG